MSRYEVSHDHKTVSFDDYVHAVSYLTKLLNKGIKATLLLHIT